MSKTQKPYIICISRLTTGAYAVATCQGPFTDIIAPTAQLAQENMLEALKKHANFDPDRGVVYFDLDAKEKEAYNQKVRAEARLIQLDGKYYVAAPKFGLLQPAPDGAQTDVQQFLDLFLPLWTESHLTGEKLGKVPQKVEYASINGARYEITSRWCKQPGVGAWEATGPDAWTSTGPYTVKSYGATRAHAVSGVVSAIETSLRTGIFVSSFVDISEYPMYVYFNVNTSKYYVSVPSLFAETVAHESLEKVMNLARTHVEATVTDRRRAEHEQAHSRVMLRCGSAGGWTATYPNGKELRESTAVEAVRAALENKN